MKKLLSSCVLVVLIACSPIAVAGSDEWVSKDEEGAVMLYNEPCTNKEILKNIYPQFHKDFRRGEVKMSDGKDMSFCYDYTQIPEGSTTLVGPNGMPLSLRMSQFKPLVRI